MKTLKIVLVALNVIGPFAAVWLIGKERKPLTPGVYIVNMVLSGLTILAILN